MKIDEISSEIEEISSKIEESAIPGPWAGRSEGGVPFPFNPDPKKDPTSKREGVIPLPYPTVG